MNNLHRRGRLTRELDGKAYRYQPVLSRQEHSAELMRQVLAGSGDEVATAPVRGPDDRPGGERDAGCGMRDAPQDRRRADDRGS
ncbi:BlaI/MecI/CopY family transcriptional regulator [Kribbella yunnanensis]|uniref:BlaI/MecI/CopY family transcriptional regulator n=1 Tax=Kribbella yunnanensis TaxID=190194 RepID=UPI0031E2865E